MARKRMIDPGFWSDEKIIELEFGERLLFIGYWNYADDNGVHTNSVKSLKAQVFPADDVSNDTVQTFLQGLINKQLLIPYHNDQFLFCPMWVKHQSIKSPQNSSNPLPPIGSYNEQKKHYTDGTLKTIIAEFLASSESFPKQFPNDSAQIEEKRIEKKRKEEEENSDFGNENPPPPHAKIIQLSSTIPRMMEKEFGRPLTPTELELIGKWQDIHTDDIISNAVKRAVIQGKRNFKYIDTILFDWESHGLNTLQDILEYEEKFKNRKLKAVAGSPRGEPQQPAFTDADLTSAEKYIGLKLKEFKSENPRHSDNDIRQFLNSSIFDYEPELKKKVFEKLNLTRYLERGP